VQDQDREEGKFPVLRSSCINVEENDTFDLGNSQHQNLTPWRIACRHKLVPQGMTSVMPLVELGEMQMMGMMMVINDFCFLSTYRVPNTVLNILGIIFHLIPKIN